jgi:predicted nucleic acid-binding Zn finger protein
LWAATEAFALTGQIDRTANINSSRVWLFTGKKDLVVNSGSCACVVRVSCVCVMHVC